MAALLRRLAGTHRGRVPLGAAAAAVCSGAALFYASSSPAVVRKRELARCPHFVLRSPAPSRRWMGGDAVFFSLFIFLFGSRWWLIAGAPGGEGRGSRWESWWVPLSFRSYCDLGFCGCVALDQIYVSAYEIFLIVCVCWKWWLHLGSTLFGKWSLTTLD